MKAITVTSVEDLQAWFDKSPAKPAHHYKTSPYGSSRRDTMSPLMLSGYNQTRRDCEDVNDQGEPMDSTQRFDLNFELYDIQPEYAETTFDIDQYLTNH
jgi:hypothetical protein